jgi:hypothetical protein
MRISSTCRPVYQAVVNDYFSRNFEFSENCSKQKHVVLCVPTALVLSRESNMYHFKLFRHFLRNRMVKDDSGAVTIDFVVMSASIVLIGAMIINVIRGGVYDVSNSIDARLTAASSEILGTSPSNPLSYEEYLELTGDDFLAAQDEPSLGPRVGSEDSDGVVWADGYFVQYPD